LGLEALQTQIKLSQTFTQSHELTILYRVLAVNLETFLVRQQQVRWIALEDVTPGSGELEYYPSSHMLPPYLFGGKYIWVDEGDPELAQFSENLHGRAKQAGLSKQRFLAKKGMCCCGRLDSFTAAARF
jgi:hypothetical protein